MQLEVINSPFSQEQAELLNRVLPRLTETQKVWLSGYLASSQQASATTNIQVSPLEEALEVEEAVTPQSTRNITILYGTDTGNSQGLAQAFFEKLKDQNFNVTISVMDNFKPKEIKGVQDLLIVTSTHGDGDPPDNALAFHEFLHSKRAPKLNDVRYSVLALGDSSYEFFCQTGVDFDQRLEELGAKRIYPRIDCDMDFEEPAQDWIESVLERLSESKVKSDATIQQVSVQQSTHYFDQPKYSKKNPFKAEVLDTINLNGRGSNKNTLHVELDLEGSNFEIEPGDSLGIIPQNDVNLVNQLINEMDWNPVESVRINKEGDLLSLREALTSHFDITTLTKLLLEKAVGLTTDERLRQLVESDRDKINAYLDGRDLLDLVQDFGPWKGTVQDFISILRKLPPRLYSVASSLKANPDEVHLTIGTVRYHAHGRDRVGVCSGYIAERIKVGDQLSVYVQKNDSFRLPNHPDTPVIMIGAGTGVAPYRAFLAEREEIGAKGETWLFFGDQHFTTDFLYQIEWQNWLKEGVLTRLDLAFSRDSNEKVYVQHRMLENSTELYQWLERGAHIYVCGDEKQMAKDVHETLLTIIKQEGEMTREEAESVVTLMRKEKRYQRDVY